MVQLRQTVVVVGGMGQVPVSDVRILALNSVLKIKTNILRMLLIHNYKVLDKMTEYMP